MFKLVAEKAKESEIKLPISTGSSKSKRVPQNTDYAKVFDCVDHNKLESSEGDVNTRPPDLPLVKSAFRSGSNS